MRDHLGDEARPYDEVGAALGVHPNLLRYATPTGTLLIRWEGARRPLIRSVAAPDLDPSEARLELARRYLHVFGPGTVEGFGEGGAARAGRGRHVRRAGAVAHRRRHPGRRRLDPQRR